MPETAMEHTMRRDTLTECWERLICEELCMALSPEQAQRVEYLLSDEWVDMEGDQERTHREFMRVLGEVTSPDELHAFADGFNWDCGAKELLQVIRHPMCDRGTALLVYWRSQPGYYLQYADRASLRPEQQELFDLQREIENRIRAGDYQTAVCTYDPQNDHGQDNRPSPQRIKRFGRDLPREMYAPVPFAQCQEKS
jgi:hypothetical protein